MLKEEREQDQTIGLASGRTVGFADYGVPGATAVLWCHGGPGSRLEPAYLRRSRAVQTREHPRSERTNKIKG
jgi:hypothetical protein